MHRSLEAVWERLFHAFRGARFERRSDLILWLFPPVPIPQVNGPWVVHDSAGAADALADAIEEVDAAGAWPWVQTRSGHDRTRQAAIDLGLTHLEEMPGMVLRPGELNDARAEIQIADVGAEEIDATNELLAMSFGAPKDVLDLFSTGVASIEEAAWYIGRAHDEIVATAIGFTVGDATGIFNVATHPEHRGRGFGAALTSHAVRDGFEKGASFAYLQSSGMGHSVYRALGFRDVERYTLLTRPAAT